jgi:hypothetical protein
VGQRWQPCLRPGRVESAKTGSVAPACRRCPAPSALRAIGRRPPPVGVSFAQKGGIFRIGITPRTDRPSSPWGSRPTARSAGIGRPLVSGKTRHLGAMPGIGPEHDRRPEDR